jgi:hypothetical protein
MKQKDIALIIVIVAVSAVVSLLLSNAIFGSPSKRNQKAEVVQPITADFPQPDTRYFNSQAIDPTQVITIQQNANSAPFNSSNPQP